MMDWRGTGYRVGKDWVVRKALLGEVTFEQRPWYIPCQDRQGEGHCWHRDLQVQRPRSENKLREVIKEQKQSQLGGK